MATYTETLLASGERILRRAHQHWFVLVAHARYAILAILLAAVLLVARLMINDTGVVWDLLGIVTLVLFVVGLAMLLWGWLRYQNEEYVITSRRIIHAEGVVNKKATDSSLEKINDAILTESVFGRLFGFGDLDVLTASETGIERLRMLRDAKSFKKSMLEAKHELELELTRPTMPPLRSEPVPAGLAANGFAGPAIEPGPEPPLAPAGGPRDAASRPARAEPSMSTDEVANALDRLGDLRDRGLITPEEFDAKKRELLDRL